MMLWKVGLLVAKGRREALVALEMMMVEQTDGQILVVERIEVELVDASLVASNFVDGKAVNAEMGGEELKSADTVQIELMI